MIHKDPKNPGRNRAFDPRSTGLASRQNLKMMGKNLKRFFKRKSKKVGFDYRLSGWYF